MWSVVEMNKNGMHVYFGRYFNGAITLDAIFKNNNGIFIELAEKITCFRKDCQIYTITESIFAK